MSEENNEPTASYSSTSLSKGFSFSATNDNAIPEWRALVTTFSLIEQWIFTNSCVIESVSTEQYDQCDGCSLLEFLENQNW